jgi:hypothetical protein
MPTAVLTLQYPKGLKGLPIATTSDLAALRFFKRTVLEEWGRKINQTKDPGEAILYRLEYQRLKAALNLFVPEEDSTNEEQA